MDHKSCRLFNDRHIPILEMDLERYLLRVERWHCREGMEIDFNGLSAAYAIPGLICMSFYADSAGTIQRLDLRSSKVFQALREKNIQAKPPVVRTGLELHFG
jgi:hypothetical protein